MARLGHFSLVFRTKLIADEVIEVLALQKQRLPRREFQKEARAFVLLFFQLDHTGNFAVPDLRLPHFQIPLICQPQFFQEPVALSVTME